MTHSSRIDTGYSNGHPWHYVLDGDIRSPKQILADVKASGIRGYMIEDIDKASKLVEPKRSAKLRQLTSQVKGRLHCDLSRYREVVLQLHRDRLCDRNAQAEPRCRDVHVSVSLKYNHICNDFAHLIYLESIDMGQMELFDF
ncbi:MAG: hypothetical protein JKY99_03665 [Rhizobiales bacterium]|nr:hypothetical protein [Hyphomicrobiales bacterium]